MDRRGEQGDMHHNFMDVNKVHNTEEREKKELSSKNERIEGDHGRVMDKGNCGGNKCEDKKQCGTKHECH